MIIPKPKTSVFISKTVDENYGVVEDCSGWHITDSKQISHKIGGIGVNLRTANMLLQVGITYVIQNDYDNVTYTKDELIEKGKSWLENAPPNPQIETGKIGSPKSGCYMFEISSYFLQIRDDSYSELNDLKNAIYGLMSLGLETVKDKDTERKFLLFLKTGLDHQVEE